MQKKWFFTIYEYVIFKILTSFEKPKPVYQYYYRFNFDSRCSVIFFPGDWLFQSFTTDFSSSCGSFCEVNIEKCSANYNKRIGVKLTIMISSSNLSIESKANEDIAFIECDFSTLTNPDNDSKFLRALSLSLSLSMIKF